MEETPQYWKNLSLENIRYTDTEGIEREEMWLPVGGYEGLYEASDLGRIKGLSRQVWNGHIYYELPLRIVTQSVTDNRGYVRSAFTDNDGVSKQIYVHVVIAKTFIPNPKNKRTVNHIKGVKTDNRKWTIEWNTYGENHKHSYKELGRIHSMKGVTGYANKKSKELLCITTGIKYGSLSEAGRELKIPFQNISKVCKGKRPNAHGLVFKYVNE